MASAEPELNATVQASLTVQEPDLASSLPTELALVESEYKDAFPAVLATSRLIALMEVAAARLLTPLLKPGEFSVGVYISITHTKPSNYPLKYGKTEELEKY
jgi:fluoroacetyl-CoA thioesterase